MKDFTAPKRTIGTLPSDVAARIAAAATDVALVVDDGGVIRDMAVGSQQLAERLVGAEWLGVPWSGLVTQDSRGKVAELVGEATSEGPSRWRHLNHTAPDGRNVPILFSTIRLRPDCIMALGRDLQPMAALQQRLVEVQQSVERDYSRLRNAEARYRVLFQTTSEPVLLLDTALRVTEANPAAARLFGDGGKGAKGRNVTDILHPDSQGAVLAVLSGVRGGGRAEEVRARLAGTPGDEVLIAASLLRQEKSAALLLRIASASAGAPATTATDPRRKLLHVVEAAPDAFLVTGADGRILLANNAFLEMAQLAAEEQARGEPVDRWLGRPGVDFDVLAANLRMRGPVRLFPTVIHGEHGAQTEVEVSAVAVPNGDEPCFGFTIRDVGPRPATAAEGERSLPRSVDQLTELVGRVPLKELVREATDVIERLAIEAALNLSNDNRASAAEMLGLSRQSLYVKLRRYGLGDLGGEEAES
ncbi:MAG TPA: transcriptional regulator PpsR [Acetobacteraceae bacterium]|nr:transcriptional regulator PpsR [Acetobacteraceae bacterium]